MAEQIILTEIQATYLKALNLLEMNYLAKDFDGDIYAFTAYPEKSESTDYQCWACSCGGDECFSLTYSDQAVEALSPLCEWKDEEPLNIMKTLAAGELVFGI